MPGGRVIKAFLCVLVVLGTSLTEGKYFKTPGSHSTSSNNLNNAIPTALTTRGINIKNTPLESTQPDVAAQQQNTATPSPKAQPVTSRIVGVGSTANATLQKAANPGLTKPRGLPYWIYIVIGVAALAVLLVLFAVLYSRFIKWKDHGSYMVWDETDLETSPAFTRESEFLLDTLTADPELASTELQQYEIPLDSISHVHVYVSSTKKVAPKRPSQDDGRNKDRIPKDSKKKDSQFNMPSLTKFTKRGTVYNSVTDTCMTSVMSEGTLNGDMTLSGNTLSMLSNGHLDKYGSLRNDSSLYPHFENISPKGTLSDKYYSLGHSRTRSTSNLLQVRPLPAVPLSKRFSKSLDKLRLFHTLPEIKPKHGRKRPLPDLPLHPPPLVKAASFGCHVNRIIENNNGMLPKVSHLKPVLGQRKMSLDVQLKSPPEGRRKSLLSSKFSKSLDTLLLLRNVERMPIDIDLYHSYESVQGRQANEVEYASVSDSHPNSPVLSESGSYKSAAEHRSSSQCDQEEGNVYASVSEDETESDTDSRGNPPPPGNPLLPENPPPSGDTLEYGELPFERSLTMSSTSSVATSPYACIRISQITGLTTLERLHENEGNCTSTENSGDSLETPENSGSTTGTVELKQHMNSARSSTHTYLELFPDEACRDSVISETSSGYARPVDLLPEMEEIAGRGTGSMESRKSLTDIEIPIESRQPFEDRGTQRTRSSDSKGYDNPVTITDDSQDEEEYYIDMGTNALNTGMKSEHIYENSQVGLNKSRESEGKGIYENSDVALEVMDSDEERIERQQAVKVQPSLQIGEEIQDETIV